MPTLKLDPLTHDLAISNNKLSLISGADEVTQRLRSRLKMFRGEWFLDLNKGVPYRTEVFVKGISTERIASAIKREILTTPGVLQLLSYSQSLDGASRLLSVDFQVLTSDGEIIFFSEGVA